MTEQVETVKPAAATLPAEERATGLVSSLVRLGLGGASLGTALLRGPATLESEVAQALDGTGSNGARTADAGQESTVSRMASGAVGLAMQTENVTRRTANRVWDLNKRVARAATAPLVKPLDALGVTDLAMRQIEAMSSRVEPVVSQLEVAGRSELVQSRDVTLDRISGAIDIVVGYLSQSQAVVDLIDAQVDRLLPTLADHPAVERLITAQVDKILPQLAENVAITALIETQVNQVLPSLAANRGITDLINAQVDQVLPSLADNSHITDLINAQVEHVLPSLAGNAQVTALIQAQVDKLLPLLSDNTGIQTLIQAQVKSYLDFLMENPEQIQELIRSQGDVYIEYLNLHPDSVQTLIQGQSVGLVGDVMDEVRERTVTADSAVEMIVRNLLGRKPRWEVPPPPPEVQRRAEMTRLPSDFVRNHKEGGDER